MAMPAPFRAPKRKRWPREPYEGPFPVPIRRRAPLLLDGPTPVPLENEPSNTDVGAADPSTTRGIRVAHQQPGSVAPAAGPSAAVENESDSMCGNLGLPVAAVTFGEGREGSDESERYRGELVHSAVLVRDRGDMEALYSRGFFGKGFLSKSRPQFSETRRFTPPGSQPCRDPRRDREQPGTLPGTRSVETVSLLCGAATSNGNNDAVGDGACPRQRDGSAVGHDDGDNAAGREVDRDSDGAARLDSAHAAHTDSGATTATEEVPDESCKPIVGCQQKTERIAEHLQLALEEAFFLAYALGCLTVSLNEEELSLSELWRVCVRACPRFLALYPAYHYFRSRGWVPKPGLKYGTDLLLYRKGPPFYHASYSVVVEMVDGANFRGDALRTFSWRSLAGLNRTTMNVSKELLLCFVVRPAGLTEEELSSPECLRRLRVQEVVVGRWVSGRERGNRDDLDL
ncbi:tRNA-splicing endonuclease subunit Sen2-like [Lethenteron reissneri]|uniref:tRNA-splicing endonuclease subunit Sen2-like n=1 Tax=Lethenteron reissneri TaxID=7753 RepID=UPI002AB6933A|nr:tRNA-splicing endonuclease subunit Sen2-like [Lethenteron reissneri]